MIGKKKSNVPHRYLRDDGSIDTSRLKSETSIVDVAAASTKLRPSGAEHAGLCPLHREETPSFFVNEALGIYHCFGCDAGGDVIDLRRRLSGETFAEACASLAGGFPPPPVRHADTNARMRDDMRRTALHRARQEWREGRVPDGTVVESYLSSRSLLGHIPSSIRYGVTPRFWTEDGRPWKREPAMLAALRDRDGRIVGIQRTFLDTEGRKSRTGRARLALGRTKGAAIRFGPAQPNMMLVVGAEEAMALRLMFTSASVWAAVGDSNLAHIELPDVVSRVIVCGDADASGRAAVASTRSLLEGRGVCTAALFPKAGAKDFNAEWTALHA